MKFREWLKKKPQNANVTEIDCSNSELTDLNGLEHFTKLTKLNCSSNALKELPDLPNIVELNCENNKLEKLPALPNCKVLICGENKLKEIPQLPKCVELHYENKFPYNEYTSPSHAPHSKIEKLPELQKCKILICGGNDLNELLT